MELQVTNNGEFPIRIIVDSDNVNDETLEPGEVAILNSRDQGTIEFRELGKAE